ncbi:MAG TPA: UDP-glucose 4-epimerase GalE [Chitinivibrionales bacterium]|jgi:UDP-glucose 4-epimerase|nr:UDP-glucose 4-epimerase GalE [Chitinivibrionales bacterium]
MSRILVIGGAGYIGSHVVCALLDRGDSVTVFDNLSTGCRENLFGEAAFVQGDILGYPLLLATVRKGFDAVVHLAALKAAGESMTAPEKYSVNNICGTVNILNAASEAGIPRIVFSSSAAVYGVPVRIPMDEGHPTDPINFYGFTKLEIERLLSWYERLRGIRFAALRYFNAAGYDPAGRIHGLEKNPQNLLPIIMETAAGTRPFLSIFGSDWDTSDGTGVRDYIHVSDLADGHLRALDHVAKRNESITVNLGSENGISVKTMIDVARRVTGRPIEARQAPRRPGDSAVVIASSKKAASVLGWHPAHSDCETLIADTWNVYKNLQR